LHDFISSNNQKQHEDLTSTKLIEANFALIDQTTLAQKIFSVKQQDSDAKNQKTDKYNKSSFNQLKYY